MRIEWVGDPVPRYKRKGSPESDMGVLPSYINREEDASDETHQQTPRSSSVPSTNR